MTINLSNRFPAQDRPASSAPPPPEPVSVSRRALSQAAQAALSSLLEDFTGVYGLFGIARGPAELGDIRWVGTDMQGRPIYEMRIIPGKGPPMTRRYALDRAGPAGRAQFVPPAEMLSGELSRTTQQGFEAGVEAAVERQVGDISDLFEAPGVSQVFLELSSGRLSTDEARARLRGLGVSDTEASQLIDMEVGFDPFDRQMINRALRDFWSPDRLARLDKELKGKKELKDKFKGAPGAGGSEFDDFLQSLLDSFQRAAGGGGRRYQGPDPNLVRDSVRGLLVTMVGQSDDERVQALTNVYLRDHRRQFDGMSVDPAQSVKDFIRGYDDYKRLHALRPEGVDELDWIPTQVSRLQAAGVRAGEIDERAMVQAGVGVSPARAGESAFVSEMVGTGRASMPQFFDRFTQAAAASMRRVG